MLYNTEIFDILEPKPKITKYKYINKCSECLLETLINDCGQNVCTSCGTVQEPILTIERNLDDINTNEQSVYKRKNHFIDYIRRLQGQQKTVISNDIINELKKTFPIEPTPRQLRKSIPSCYCRSLNMIYNLCWGKELPHFMSTDVELFQKMFNKVTQVSKELYNLKHFFHIHYLLYQFCKLAKKEKYIKFIDRVKNIKTINRYNEMWKNICIKLNWLYMSYS